MAVIHLLPVILFAVSPAAFYGVSVLWLVLLSAVTCYTDLWLMQKPFPLPAGRNGMTGQTRHRGKRPLRTNLRRGHF